MTSTLSFGGLAAISNFKIVDTISGGCLLPSIRLLDALRPPPQVHAPVSPLTAQSF